MKRQLFPLFLASALTAVALASFSGTSSPSYSQSNDYHYICPSMSTNGRTAWISATDGGGNGWLGFALNLTSGSVSGVPEKVKRPRIARDGNAVVYFGAGSNGVVHPYISFLSGSTYTPSTTDVPSNTVFAHSEEQPPGVSDDLTEVVGGVTYHYRLVTFKSLYAQLGGEEGPHYGPILVWKIRSDGSVNTIVNQIGPDGSGLPDISADGAYVAYRRGDNGYLDVVNSLTDANLDGENASPTWIRMDGTGDYVAFSTTTSLEASDTNSQLDVYVLEAGVGSSRPYDEPSGDVSRAVGFDPDISADGNWVSFTSCDEDFGYPWGGLSIGTPFAALAYRPSPASKPERVSLNFYGNLQNGERTTTRNAADVGFDSSGYQFVASDNDGGMRDIILKTSHS